jgi:putative peptidoglycan lipid II flippase
MAATLGSTILGFLREIIGAKYYGTQWQMDTYLAAAMIPTILFGVFNGALTSALVPTFSEYLARGEREEAWRLGNTIVNLLALILTLCAVLGYVFAPYYVPLIAHGFPPPQMGVAIRMTRWLMPSIVAVAISGVFSGILNAFSRFRSAAMVGMALNVVTIACVVILNRKYGIYALVAGTALGLIAQMIVQIPAFLSLGGYRLTLDIHHPGLRRMWKLLGPMTLGSSAGQLALFFDRYFASTLPAGYIAGMSYAVKLVNFPQQIFATAIATVIFPLLAMQFAQADREGLARSAMTGLRLVNFITIPAVCALIVLARPIVSTLFERGSFGATSVDLTAGLLPYAAVGLVALAANVVLTRCLVACRRISWQVAVSVFTVVLNVVLSLTWLPTLGARGLLLANAVSQTLQMLALLVLLARFVAGIDWGALFGSAMKIAACAFVMVVVLNWIASLGVAPQAALLSRVWFLFGQIAIGALVFIAVARLLDVEELSMAWSAIVAKFERNLIPPSENRDAPIT